MRRALLVIAFLACASTRINATTVSVPSQQPTIAAALATTADSILVDPGTFAEDIVIGRPLALIGSGETRVRSITTTNGIGVPGVRIRRVHAEQQIRTGAIYSACLIDACAADSGIAAIAYGGLTIQYCTTFRDIQANGGPININNCRVIGGGIRAFPETGGASVSQNFVNGPTPIGIAVGEYSSVTGNVVCNTAIGVQVSCYGYVGVTDNVVLDCASDGIRVVGGPSGCPAQAIYAGNLVIRCGGDGMQVGGTLSTVSSNRVLGASGAGVIVNDQVAAMHDNEVRDCAGAGFKVQNLAGSGPESFGCLRNRAVHCGLSGFEITYGAGRIRENIAGRNGGDGFRINRGDFEFSLRSNNAYLNAGDAYDLTGGGTPRDTIRSNIGFVSSQYGVRWTQGAGSGPVVECNDWFGNGQGVASGIAVGSTDLTVDPRLCRAVSDDVSLASNSPALNAPGCGRIGPIGLGCLTAVAVQEAREPEFGAVRVIPSPSSGTIRFAWPRAARACRVEVIDATGARRWSRRVPGGAEEFVWDGRDDDGRTLPAGVYFVHVNDGARSLQSRLVIVH